MTKNDSTFLKRHSVLVIGLLVGLGFYFADIVIDVFVFRSGSLKQELLNPTYHEVWMRTAVLIVAVAFAIYIQRLLRRERQAGERTKTAEDFLNSVVDNIPNMVFIKDAGELRFIHVNRTGKQLLGLTTEELIGKNDYDLFPETQADFFTRKDREVLETGIEADIPEEQLNTAALGSRWLHTRKVPILDKNGKSIYLLGISEDITQAKQVASELKETEIRFQTLFNSAADCVFVFDRDGKILEANRYACEHTGYEKREIVGENIRKLFTKESQDTCDCSFLDLRERGYSRVDIEVACKDGRRLQMECMATGVPDETGNFTTFLNIQRDVTEKKKAEENGRQQQREMAHVMRLSTMGEMASGIAHELNQPLAALVSYCGTAETLANSLSSPPPELLDVLERAREQAHRASQIIRHLRDFVSKGGEHREPVNLDQTIEEMISFIKPELKNCHVTVEHRPGATGCHVMADKVQIEQVLINLLRNSLDAIQSSGNTSGKVVIKTTLLPDKVIETTVTDNGPGIAVDMAGRLFNPFHTSKASGMGMGLSISRSIIEAQGGKLWADEKYRGGAIFGFSIPGCQ